MYFELKNQYFHFVKCVTSDSYYLEFTNDWKSRYTMWPSRLIEPQKAQTQQVKQANA